MCLLGMNRGRRLSDVFTGDESRKALERCVYWL